VAINQFERSTFFRALCACLAAGLIGAGGGCAQQPQQSPAPLVVGQLREVTGTVAAVDLPNRLVSLRNAAGEYVTVKARSDVRNLAQVRVGDRVSVGYFEGIAAEVKPVDKAVKRDDKSVTTARAPLGERPAGAVAQTLIATVKIEGVDTTRHTVTFRRQDGLLSTLAVQRPESREFIRQLKVGDEMEVTYTQAVAIAVNPAQ
jgi:hypothetical protein